MLFQKPELSQVQTELRSCRDQLEALTQKAGACQKLLTTSDYHEWLSGKDVKSIENLKTLLLSFINCSNSFWLILLIFSHLLVSFHTYLRLLSFSQMELLLVTLPCHALSHRATPCFMTRVTTMSPHVATMSWHGTGGSCWRSSAGAEQQKPGDPSRSVTEKPRSSLENRCKTANTHCLMCTRYSYMFFLLFFYVFDLCIFCYTFLHVLHIYLFVLFTMSFFAYSAEFCLKFSCTTY